MRDRFANSFKAATSMDVPSGLVVLSSEVTDVDIGVEVIGSENASVSRNGVV